MLKIESILKLAEVAKLTPEQVVTLKALHASEKEEALSFELPKINTFTDDELTVLKKNTERTGYDIGKIAGIEMDVKAIRDEMGLSFDGKTVKNLLEAATKKALLDANIAPDKKVNELNADLDKLRKNITTLESEKTNLLSDFTSFKQTIAIDSEIVKHIPDNLGGLSKEDNLTLLKSVFTPKMDEGKLVFLKNGETIKDQTATPLTADKVVNLYAETKKFSIPKTPGRGGSDYTGPSGFKTLNEVMLYLEKEGITSQSEKGKVLIKQAQDEGLKFAVAT